MFVESELLLSVTRTNEDNGKCVKGAERTRPDVQQRLTRRGFSDLAQWLPVCSSACGAFSAASRTKHHYSLSSLPSPGRSIFFIPPQQRYFDEALTGPASPRFPVTRSKEHFLFPALRIASHQPQLGADQSTSPLTPTRRRR